VADGAPGPAQALGRGVQHAGDAGPVGREVGRGDGLQRSVRLFEQLVHGGRHMLGKDLVEQREVGEREKRVVLHGAHFAAGPKKTIRQGN
jgi:hypothetical protein